MLSFLEGENRNLTWPFPSAASPALKAVMRGDLGICCLPLPAVAPGPPVTLALAMSHCLG